MLTVCLLLDCVKGNTEPVQLVTLNNICQRSDCVKQGQLGMLSLVRTVHASGRPELRAME